MSELSQDLRFALRGFRRSPGFAAVALLTLGLGTGAVVAIFAAVNQVVLRPLPFDEPDELVMLWEANEERGWELGHAAPANVMDWRERAEAFDDIAFFNEWTGGMALLADGDAVEVTVGLVSGNLFRVLGVAPRLGRSFTFQETWEGTDPVVILSHGSWQGRFGGDPQIVGRTLRLDGIAHTVVGVMGPGFRDPFDHLAVQYGDAPAEMWTTYRWGDDLRASVWFRQAHVVRAVGRLAPGATLDGARAELEAVARQLQVENPELNRGMEAGLTPLHEFLVGDRRTPLLLLMGAVGVLQLIACANVANLLLVRATHRRQEMAVRTALGAGRGRVARQLLTESAVLAAGGAALGLLLAPAGLRWIAGLRPPGLDDLAFHLDLRLVGFTLAVSAFSALLFGVVPVVRSRRMNLAGELADASRSGTAGRGSRRLASGMVAAEIGLAVMLVVAAGLMVRSLQSLRSVDPGVDTRGVLTFRITPPSGSYGDGERAALSLRLVEALEEIPGVASAAAGRGLPLRGGSWTSDFTVEGWAPEEYGVQVRHREATGGWFETLGIPVLDGEPFDDVLAAGDRVPVVVNRAFAERYFPDDSPVGRHIAFDREPDENSYWYPIVAVVGDERREATREPEPTIIAHLYGDVPSTISFAVRAESGDPLDLLPAVRETLRRLDPEIPLVEPQPLDDVVTEALGADRFLLTLLGIFGVAALVLAAVGVYGVAAQAARARTREIGIRRALGASNSRIVRALVVRQAAWVGAGVALGLAGSLAAGRLMSGFLYGVEPTDPVTLAGVAALLAAVALASTWIPARRAARGNPVTVLQGR